MLVSCDIETLGLHPYSPIIQIGAVVFDPRDKPGVHRGGIEFLVEHDEYEYVEPYAAAMNWKIMAKLGNYPGHEHHSDTKVHYASAAHYFRKWLDDNWFDRDEKITFTGKNFASFDQPRLNLLPEWTDLIKVHHRVLDPGTLYYTPAVDGDTLPDTATCMERAGIKGEVAHTALEDAAQVAKMIQLRYSI